MTIYIIERVSTNYDHDYPDTDRYIEDEAGYFTDKAEAEKWAEKQRLDENSKAYEAYKNMLAKNNTARLEDWAERERAVKALKDAGIKQNLFTTWVTRTKPVPQNPVSFEEYCKQTGESFEIIELAPNKES